MLTMCRVFGEYYHQIVKRAHVGSQRKKLHRSYGVLLKNKTVHIFGLKPLDVISQNNTYTMRKRNQNAIKLTYDR
jgi:hypothetical protein